MSNRITYADVLLKVQDINGILAEHGFVFHMNYGEAYENSCTVGLERNAPGVDVQSAHMGRCDNKLFEGNRRECFVFVRGYVNGLTTEHQQERFTNLYGGG